MSPPLGKFSQLLNNKNLSWTKVLFLFLFFHTVHAHANPPNLTLLVQCYIKLNTNGKSNPAFSNSWEKYNQSCSVTQSCPTLCDPMNRSVPGLPVHHQLLEFTQTHVHRVGDAIKPSHPLLSPSPPALKISQNQGLFQWVSSLHQVAKVLEFQLQHQSFQWIFRTDFL